MNLKLTKEIKAALFVLLGVFLFLIGFNFLNGTSLFKSEKNLYAIYDQVEGLQSGTTVTVNGLSVGKVSSIDFLPNSNRILVKFTVRNDLNFSKNSIAEIYESGLIGGKSIAIIPVLDRNRILVSGDTLVSRTKPGLTDVVGSEIAPLQKKLEQILINVDTLVSSLNTVLDDKAQQGLNKALSEVSVTVSNLNSISNSLSKILVSQESNINQTINNFSEASANINQISDSLSKTDLKALVSEIENTATTLNSIFKSIDSGEGTLGKLMKDDGLYNNLEASTKEVKLLIKDLKEHPKRYVHFSLFGKKETPYNSDKKN
ncbi:MAG: ABC transporter substrate-binding protein [Flavobacteriales bacterium]|nr:ABC transporter substrate-binding protein [Candidatus Arcticimaribacter sp.]